MANWTIKWGKDEGEQISVRSFPSRPFVATKVYSEGFSTYAVNAKGELFCTRVKGGRGYFSELSSKTAAIVLAFHTMGVFKNDKPKRVAEALAAMRRRDERRYHAKYVAEYAKKADIPLTLAQVRKIRALGAKVAA